MVVHMSYLQDMALPEDWSRKVVPPVRLWRVAVCMLSRQSPTDDKGQSSWLAAGRQAHSPSPYDRINIVKCYRCITVGKSFNGCVGLSASSFGCLHRMAMSPRCHYDRRLDWAHMWKESFNAEYIRARMAAYKCHTSIRLQGNGKL